MLSIAALVMSSPAAAQPPPGHPPQGQAREMLMPDRPSRPEELPHQGKVLSAIDANDFTYIEVAQDGPSQWIAAPRMAVKPGSIIRYEDGSVMTNFYSKLLKRTFPHLMFVGEVVVTAAP
jgi:hypothetical protein